jgi:hypothetical protein
MKIAEEHQVERGVADAEEAIHEHEAQVVAEHGGHRAGGVHS